MELSEFQRRLTEQGKWNRWFYISASVVLVTYALYWVLGGLHVLPQRYWMLDNRTGREKQAAFTVAVLMFALGAYFFWRLKERYRIHRLPDLSPATLKLDVIKAYFAQSGFSNLIEDGHFLSAIQAIRSWHLEVCVLVGDAAYHVNIRDLGYMGNRVATSRRISQAVFWSNRSFLTQDWLGTMDFGTSARAFRSLRRYLEKPEGKG